MKADGKIFYRLSVVIVLLGVSGCASWDHHGVGLASSKVPVVVLPVQNTLKIKHLDDIQTLAGEDQVITNESDQIIRTHA